MSIQALKGAHAGHTAWIIGKGPSLVMLTKDQIGAGPIIAINEATITIESLGLENVVYSLQKDADRYEYSPGPIPLGGDEPIAPLRGATLLVHQHESAGRMKEYRPRFVFDNVADFELEWWEFSSLVAVAIARLMGCPRVVFVAHDACVFGDARTCTARVDGSFQVDTDWRSAANYVHHRQRLDDYLSRVSMTAEWLTPEAESVRHREDRRLAEELTREVERLRLSLDESGRANEALVSAQATVSMERDAALHQADRLQASLDDKSRDLEALTRAHTTVSADRHAVLRQVDELTAQLAGAHDALRALRASRSWRWMAPLRAAADLLERARSLVGRR